MCDRGASYAVKQMVRWHHAVKQMVRCGIARLCSAYYDEREDTMDEREVHTSLVNIAYSGASTRNNIY